MHIRACVGVERGSAPQQAGADRRLTVTAHASVLQLHAMGACACHQQQTCQLLYKRPLGSPQARWPPHSALHTPHAAPPRHQAISTNPPVGLEHLGHLILASVLAGCTGHIHCVPPPLPAEGTQRTLPSQSIRGGPQARAPICCAALRSKLSLGLSQPPSKCPRKAASQACGPRYSLRVQNPLVVLMRASHELAARVPTFDTGHVQVPTLRLQEVQTTGVGESMHSARCGPASERLGVYRRTSHPSLRMTQLRA